MVDTCGVCGGERGDRTPADRDGRGCLEDVNHTEDYPVATICGTMRLAEDMRTVAEWLTREGYLVLMPHVPKSGSRLHDPRPVTGEALDRMHRAKIDMADLVVFVTQERQFVLRLDLSDSSWRELYFGESTTAELAYARSLGKPIKAVMPERSEYRDTVIDVTDRVADEVAA